MLGSRACNSQALQPSETRCAPCLALVLLLALTSPAQADTPERLSDRPTPTVKLMPALGWRLSGVVTMDVQKGVDILIIEGDVFNAGDGERERPRIRVALQNSDGRDIYFWSVFPDLGRIKPGDYAQFSTRIESPPLDVAIVHVSIDDSTP